MNITERECIILNSVWAMIDDMVNWAMLVKHDRTVPTNMMFETSQHSRLFNILFGDFLSQLKPYRKAPIPLGLLSAPPNAPLSDLTFLFHLRQVCAQPKLGADTTEFSQIVEAFATWLESDTIAKGVNLADIDVVADICVSRYRYIKICGDIAKHSLARLAGNVNHIRELLKNSGHDIGEQEAYLAVEGFFEWFHNHIFTYHSSLIAEFLNNIRWAIFNYLQPEYNRSWHVSGENPDNFAMYGFHYPEECNEQVAKAMYWNLMNRVRARPWMHQFVVQDSFRMAY